MAVWSTRRISPSGPGRVGSGTSSTTMSRSPRNTTARMGGDPTPPSGSAGERDVGRPDDPVAADGVDAPVRVAPVVQEVRRDRADDDGVSHRVLHEELLPVDHHAGAAQTLDRYHCCLAHRPSPSFGLATLPRS